MNFRSLLAKTGSICLVLFLAACGGGSDSPPPPAATYTIGGTVTGLAAGQQVTLLNNGGNAKVVAANGAYTFTTAVAANGNYAVTVGTQPTGQTCSVANGSGAGVTANVTNANVTCSSITFTIGGTVSGLAAGEQVTLNNNGADRDDRCCRWCLHLRDAGAVQRQLCRHRGHPARPARPARSPTARAQASLPTSRNADITCSAITFTIGGTVSGLAAGEQVTLNNNGADRDDRYCQRCLHLRDTRSLQRQLCRHRWHPAHRQDLLGRQRRGRRRHRQYHQRQHHLLGDHLHHRRHGLGPGCGRASHADSTTAAMRRLSLPTPPTHLRHLLPFNGSYAVTVGTQPTGQTCSVSNGAGAGVTANVTNANITCSTLTFTVGGTVSGLAAGQQVTLLNNGGNATIVTANGAYTFTTPVNYNGNYAVTVGTQPTGQTCTVSNGSGASVTANITNANITLLGDHLHHRWHDLRPGIDPAGDAPQQRRQSADHHRRRRRQLHVHHARLRTTPAMRSPWARSRLRNSAASPTARAPTSRPTWPP